MAHRIVSALIFVLVGGMLVPYPSVQSQPSSEQVAADLGLAGEHLAQEIGKQLVAKGPGPGQGRYRVGVFPFGNSENKYPVNFGDNGPILRGKLADELKAYLDKNAPGKFTVLSTEQLDAVLQSSTEDPSGISGKNPDLARKVLKNYNIQIGVVGNFEIPTLPCPMGKAVNLTARAVHPTEVVTVRNKVEGTDLTNNGACTQKAPSGRFSIQFFVKLKNDAEDTDESAWKELPLSICKDRGQENVYYLVVKKEYKGLRYKVRMTNKGTPKMNLNDDKDRLYEACLMIDGVNSFFRQVGKSYRPESGHPLDLEKWVLTGPGYEMVSDKGKTFQERIKDGRLDKVMGPGGSVVEVFGFQKGDKFAAAFELAEASDSVAAPELLAGGAKIGTISAYFYPEILPDEKPGAGGVGMNDTPAGTRAGKEIKSEVFPIEILGRSGTPAEIWHINYRFEGDPLPEKLLRVKP